MRSLARQGPADHRRMVQFTLEDGGPMLWGGELILRDGKPVGELRSAAYGHTLGRSVALGYVDNAAGVDNDFLASGAFRDRSRRRAPWRQGASARRIRPEKRKDQTPSRHGKGRLEHFMARLNYSVCRLARRSTREGREGRCGASAERADNVGVRQTQTRRAGAGLSQILLGRRCCGQPARTSPPASTLSQTIAGMFQSNHEML